VEIALAATVLLFLAYTVHAVTNVGGDALDPLFQKWVNDAVPAACALICFARSYRVKAERGAWLLFGLGIASWAAANVYYSLFVIDVVPLPIPSVADGLWLAMYPLFLAALIALMRSRLRNGGARVWLDGGIAGLALASLSAALVLPSVLSASAGSSTVALMTNVAYPIGDMVLLGAVVAALAAGQWRLDRMWGSLAIGLAAFTVTDGLFLFQNANGTYVVGTWVDAGWLLAGILVATAASQLLPQRAAVTTRAPGALLVPSAFGSLALAVLIWDHFERVTPIALVLSSASVAAVVVRMALTSSENLRMLGRLRQEAESLALKNEQLLEVDHLKDELRQAQKMEALGQLAGGVAHDFNNLLTVLAGHAELLRPKVATDDSATRQLDAIATATERATELTRRLLTFSTRQVTQTATADLNDAVLEAREIMAPALGTSIRLVTALEIDLQPVRLDPGQLSQVLVNLVLNARDAMPKGGTIEIATSARGAALDDRQGFVLLTVTDTGEGMDESTRARIFEPFFTTKGTERGTGLGLATVYGIVESTGGYIAVESTLGVGSTFRLSLPTAAAAAAPYLPDDETEHPLLPQRVLLVEDEREVRQLVVQQLESHGHTVVAVPTPMQALELFEPGEFDVLITDVVMARMNGWELAQRVRTQQDDLPVLLMSGYTDGAVDLRGASASTAFLQKPFTRDELEAKMLQVVTEPDVRKIALAGAIPAA
jgi:signal transduction histidine kinase/ActR/RegA family two-component response regulator